MEIFPPVVKVRLVLILIPKMGLKAWSLAVETAYLNGNLCEEIFMKTQKSFKQCTKIASVEALKHNK